MATQRRAPAPAHAPANAASGDGKLINPATGREFVAPTITLKELRDAVPAHCFERDTLRSLSYVAVDVAAASALFYAATFIDTLLPPALRYVAWPVYWLVQGIVCTGIWVLAHECGHQAFSPSKFVNNTVGFFLHSALLVPYHSWRITHSNHHKGTNHMDRDQVFVPSTKRQRFGSKSPTTTTDPSLLEDSPLFQLWGIVTMLLFGWPAYLIANVSGQKYDRHASHFDPSAPIFEPRNALDVIVSDFGVFGMLGLLGYFSYTYGVLEVVKFYLIPYLWVNHWLVLITFLQHTDPKVPHYREKEWTFLRGALCTVDRNFGAILNTCFHHITDTHVVHHIFSQMPHYHAVEATQCVKKILGNDYLEDDKHFFSALYTNFKECKYVDDEGEILFFRTHQ